MNKEVNFEIAKLLKEKGFKQPCFYYYDKNGKLNEPYLENGSSTDTEFRVDLTDLIGYHNSYSTQYISAPTIAEVKMWLYDNYGIWVSVQKDWHTGECLGFEGIIDFIEGLIGTKTVNSPTEAYELAIKYTLENLI